MVESSRYKLSGRITATYEVTATLLQQVQAGIDKSERKTEIKTLLSNKNPNRINY